MTASPFHRSSVLLSGGKAVVPNHEDRRGRGQYGKDFLKRIGGLIVVSAIRVHRTLGPALPGSACRQWSVHELTPRCLDQRLEVDVPTEHGTSKVDAGHRLDMLVERKMTIDSTTLESGCRSTPRSCEAIYDSMTGHWDLVNWKL